MGTTFQILSPDEHPISVTDFENKTKARNYFKDWMQAYKRQGYYSHSKYGRIPVKSIAKCCSMYEMNKEGEIINCEMPVYPYQIEIPNGQSKFEAWRGRKDYPVSGKCLLQKMRINTGGYDAGGAYWGIGNPMYVCQDLSGNLYYVRAKNREDAKQQIIEKNPTAKFYN